MDVDEGEYLSYPSPSFEFFMINSALQLCLPPLAFNLAAHALQCSDGSFIH